MKESKKPDHDDKGPTWQGHGNIQSIFRFAVNDNVNIDGRIISSGQKNYCLFRVGQSWWNCFQGPIKRDTSAHLAFSSGIHFCVGAPLARLETRVVLKVLLQQLQNVTLIDEYDNKPLEPVDVLVFHWVKHLPLNFKPRLTDFWLICHTLQIKVTSIFSSNNDESCSLCSSTFVNQNGLSLSLR